MARHPSGGPATRDPRVVKAALRHLRAADPVLGRVVKAIGPASLRHEPNYFAALVGAIVGQQLSVRAASAIRERLGARLGAEAPLSPEALLAVPEAELRALGFSRAKAAYVADLAVRVASGALDLPALEQHPDEAVVAHLIQVKGIGRWTAEMFLMFSLGRPDVLSVDDLGFRAAVRRLYALPELPRAPALRALAEPWRPYRTFATWYLWRSSSMDPTIAVPAEDVDHPRPREGGL